MALHPRTHSLFLAFLRLRSLLQSVFQYTGRLLLNSSLPSSLSPSFGLAYAPSTPSCLSFFRPLFSGCFRRRYRGLSYSLSNDLPPPSELTLLDLLSGSCLSPDNHPSHSQLISWAFTYVRTSHADAGIFL